MLADRSLLDSKCRLCFEGTEAEEWSAGRGDPGAGPSRWLSHGQALFRCPSAGLAPSTQAWPSGHQLAATLNWSQALLSGISSVCEGGGDNGDSSRAWQGGEGKTGSDLRMEPGSPSFYCHRCSCPCALWPQFPHP